MVLACTPSPSSTPSLVSYCAASQYTFLLNAVCMPSQLIAAVVADQTLEQQPLSGNDVLTAPATRPFTPPPPPGRVCRVLPSSLLLPGHTPPEGWQQQARCHHPQQSPGHSSCRAAPASQAGWEEHCCCCSGSQQAPGLMQQRQQRQRLLQPPPRQQPAGPRDIHRGWVGVTNLVIAPLQA